MEGRGGMPRGRGGWRRKEGETERERDGRGRGAWRKDGGKREDGSASGELEAEADREAQRGRQEQPGEAEREGGNGSGAEDGGRYGQYSQKKILRKAGRGTEGGWRVQGSCGQKCKQLGFAARSHKLADLQSSILGNCLCSLKPCFFPLSDFPLTR